ncbi:MAG TPA: hypothetical protein VEX11_08510 [Acetobacteraceae bacterium]|nr:hypothetical protein [Acetobacteraceae bacterium]
MTTVHYDARCTDDERRDALYRGDIFVYQPLPAAQRLAELARGMLEAAFAPHDPRRIDQALSMEECAAVLSKLKPAFIHHPECKVLLPEIIRSIGGDPEQIHFDVPRLRSAYPENYLTSGIAYAFHPHRDTWYSAPFCQINWWLPIWEIEERNCLAFHPAYFDNPVENSSDIYNYYEWNAKNRASASQHVKSDTREQPKLTQPIERREMRLLVPPGGLILFSAAQLHETVPNTSGVARYSIDFRTVHKGDAEARRGAANLDSRSTGTTMRDYLRASDLAHLPDDVVSLYDDGTAIEGRSVVFTPEAALSR